MAKNGVALAGVCPGSGCSWGAPAQKRVAMAVVGFPRARLREPWTMHTPLLARKMRLPAKQTNRVAAHEAWRGQLAPPQELLPGARVREKFPPPGQPLFRRAGERHPSAASSPGSHDLWEKKS